MLKLRAAWNGWAARVLDHSHWDNVHDSVSGGLAEAAAKFFPCAVHSFPKVSPMKRQGWIAVVVLVVLAGGFAFMRSRGAVEQPKFRTAAAERGDIEVLVSATGTINPVVQVEVGSQVSGTVQVLRADFNDRVRRGQVLCQIEPSSFRARVLQADAAVARAAAALKEAKRQQARARELAGQKYISQADVDAADVATEQREAELQQARAQLEQWQVDLTNTSIRSPIDGVVIARTIDVGQTVAASLQSPKLFVIANDLTQMQVETRIDEADIGIVHAGLPVRFTVDAFPEESFEGAVQQVRLEPATVQGVVTYATIIRTSNPEQKLKPGMTANVSVRVALHEGVLKVPNAALRFRPSTGGRGGRPGGDGARAAGAGGAGRPGGAGMMRDGASAGAPTRGRHAAGAAPAGRGEGGVGAHDGAAMMAPRDERPRLRPGAIYLLRGGKPARVSVASGDTDGAFTRVESDSLHEGDLVIVGAEQSQRGGSMQPPAGMGGSPMGGGGGGGGRR